MEKTKKWKFIGKASPPEPFTLDGVNIWDFEWEQTGEDIIVHDPKYHQQYKFHVYQISKGNGKIKFAAGEFSNLIYGIYQIDEEEMILRSRGDGGSMGNVN